MRKHWYFISIHECPVCGRGKTYLQRRYGRKPKRASNRYEYVQSYDWCNEYGSLF